MERKLGRQPLVGGEETGWIEVMLMCRSAVQARWTLRREAKAT